jgi:hypothetical protein
MPDVLSGGTTNSWDRRWKQVGVIAAVVGAVVGTVALWPIFFSARLLTMGRRRLPAMRSPIHRPE